MKYSKSRVNANLNPVRIRLFQNPCCRNGNLQAKYQRDNFIYNMYVTNDDAITVPQ